MIPTLANIMFLHMIYVHGGKDYIAVYITYNSRGRPVHIIKLICDFPEVNVTVVVKCLDYHITYFNKKKVWLIGNIKMSDTHGHNKKLLIAVNS